MDRVPSQKMMSPCTANQTSHKAQNTKQIINHDALRKNMAKAATEPCADCMMLDAHLVEIDIKKVGENVKSDLFERTIFLWDQKALEVDGMLHKDYLTNCKSLVSGSGLIGTTDDDAASYMTCLWNKMTKRVCYKKLMQTKWANSYQAL
jgi:hypothetical protein